MSRRIWEAVEAEAGKVRIAEAEGRKKKKEAGKKQEKKEEKKKPKKERKIKV